MKTYGEVKARLSAVHTQIGVMLKNIYPPHSFSIGREKIDRKSSNNNLNCIDTFIYHEFSIVNE